MDRGRNPLRGRAQEITRRVAPHQSDDAVEGLLARFDGCMGSQSLGDALTRRAYSGAATVEREVPFDAEQVVDV